MQTSGEYAIDLSVIIELRIQKKVIFAVMQRGEQIMTLNQCTKEELIFIIKAMARRHCFTEEQVQVEIDSRLSDVVYQRQLKLLKEAENWNKISADCRQKYLELLAQYDGRKLLDIPGDIIKEANSLLKDAQYADKKWEECMKKVDEERR